MGLGGPAKEPFAGKLRPMARFAALHPVGVIGKHAWPPRRSKEIHVVKELDDVRFVGRSSGFQSVLEGLRQ